jgi:hypothetical protein
MILRYPHWKKHGRRPWHSELSRICESRLFSSLWEVFSTTWDSISCPMVETCDQKCSKETQRPDLWQKKPPNISMFEANARRKKHEKNDNSTKSTVTILPDPNDTRCSASKPELFGLNTSPFLGRWNPHVCWSRSDPSHPACFRVWGSWILAPRTFFQFFYADISYLVISAYLYVYLNTYKYHRITESQYRM